MQEISLNQNTFSLFPSVYAVQNDTGRELKMTLTDRTLVATDTAAVAVNRSDGSYYTITGTVDTATNSVTADITQALTQPGRTLCQLKITDTNDEIVSSYTFCIMVQPSTDGVPVEQYGITAQELMDAVEQIMSGSLGQPTPVTTAAEMTETDKIYLYLGSEAGYTSGDVYAYINGAWTDTGIYGQGIQGEPGEDGFSPLVSVTNTGTGVVISVTDENGTTVSTVSNGTATDAQVAAWLADHPEATTTVQDGAVTLPKLAADVRSAWTYRTGTDFSWEKNTIAGATGANSSSASYANNRIRTIGYIPANVVYLEMAAGYEMTVYAYSSADVYAGCWNGSSLANSASYLTKAYLPTIGDYKFRLVIRDANNANITTATAAQMTYGKFVDDSLSVSGKAADAKIVGDITTGLNTRLRKVENAMPLDPSVRILNDVALFAGKTTQSSYMSGAEQIGTSGIYYKDVNNRISTYPVQASVGNFNKYHIIPKNGYQYIFRAFNADLSAQTYTSGWASETSDFDFSAIDASFITLTIQNSGGSSIATSDYTNVEVYAYDITTSPLASESQLSAAVSSCKAYTDLAVSGAGKEDLYLGTFEQGAITASGNSESTKRLRQKNTVALPYGDRRKLHVKINAGYYLGIRLGVVSTNLSENLYWYSEGDVITVPAGCNYYRMSIANGTTSGTQTTITMDEWDDIGLSVYCEGGADVNERNEENTQRATNAMLKYATQTAIAYPAIVHASDVHGDYKRLRNVLDWADKHGKIARACITGDFVSNTPDHGIEWLKDEIESHATPVSVCLGNHDVLGLASDSAIYDFFYDGIATDIGNATGKTWYYVDDAANSLRFISVNLYQYGGTTIGYTHFTDEQLSWLGSVLASTPANYGVFILEHSPQVDISSARDQSYPAFFQTTRIYNNNHNAVTGDPIAEIVDAFIAGLAFSKTYTQTGSPASVSVSVDFTSKNPGAEFIAYLNGHYHEDTVCFVPGVTNRQLCLNVGGCHTMYGAAASYPYLADTSDQARNPVDKSQDVFNVYVIDRANKKIRIVRIGNDEAIASDGTTTDRKYMIIPYA